MTYDSFITLLRNQVGDNKRRVHVDWTGDGSTTAFQMPADTFPVFDTDYIVKVNSVTFTEGSQYTLDRQTGTIVFTSAPTNNHPISIDAYAVYLTNTSWLEIINAVIRSLGDDFWKEFVDDTNFTVTAGMLSLDLTSSQPNCIAVYDFWHRHSTSEDWETVENFCNWRYDRENNKIYVGNNSNFSRTGDLLKIRGLKTYTLGDSVSDTIDVQDRYLTILEYGSIARYWKYRYRDVVELVSKLSTEPSRTPLQELIMLSDRFTRDYEMEKSKLKPQKPARQIPLYREGSGRP